MDRKTLTHLFLVLVFLFSDFVVDKVAGIPKPEASVTDLEIKKVRLKHDVTFLFKVAIKNPHPLPIPIHNVEWTLKRIDRVITSGTISDSRSLKAKDITILEATLDIPYKFLFTLIKDIIGDWDIDYEIDIKIVVNLPLIGNFTLPVTHKGEFKLPKPWEIDEDFKKLN